VIDADERAKMLAVHLCDDWVLTRLDLVDAAEREAQPPARL
jgi:hypothetical protein